MVKDKKTERLKKETREVEAAIKAGDHETLLTIGTSDDKLEKTRDEALKGYIQVAKEGGTAAIPVLIELAKSGAKDEIRQMAGNAAIEVAVREKAMQYLFEITTDENQLINIRESAGKALATMYVKRNKPAEVIELFRNPDVLRSVKDWMRERSEDRKDQLDKRARENKTRLVAEREHKEAVKTLGKVIRRPLQARSVAQTQPARTNTIRST